MQEILLERIVDLEWSILKRSAQESRPEYAAKELMAMHNHLRLCLREYHGSIKREAPQPQPAPQPAKAQKAQPKARSIVDDYDDLYPNPELDRVLAQLGREGAVAKIQAEFAQHGVDAEAREEAMARLEAELERRGL